MASTNRAITCADGIGLRFRQFLLSLSLKGFRSSGPQPNTQGGDGLEAAVNHAIAACGGDMRSAIRALIVANEYLEIEVGEPMKAVSHAYVRGRFHTYSG